MHECPGLPWTVLDVRSGPGTTRDIPGRHSYGTNSVAMSHVPDALGFRVRVLGLHMPI